jgi:hypothetical protein
MRRKGGAIRGPRGGQKGGAPGYPSLSGCPLMVQCATARRVGGNRLRHRVVARCHQRTAFKEGAGRTKVGCDAKGAPRLWPSPGDAPSWEDSARRPDSASALRVGVGLTGRDGSTTRPHRSGSGSRCRRWTATTGSWRPSLLPLAVWAGELAFAGFAGSRENGTRRRCPRTTRRREGAAASDLANGNAPRHGASPNLGHRVALNEVAVMPRGRGAERRPKWASHWRFVLAARHGWRAVLRLLRPTFRTPRLRSAALDLGGRTVRVARNARSGGG